MYKIIYMKADYEPWWKFEGWEEHIVSAESYVTFEECETALYSKLQLFRKQFPHERCKDRSYWAFWTEDEHIYCEGCDEEQQVYHGIILVSE